MFDEDLPRKKTDGEFPRNLDNMSVHELEEYVQALKAEIERAQADMARKRASQEAASSIFK